MDEKADSEWIAADSARLWLTDLLIKPYSGRLRDVSRLTVIADDPVPAHLLGSNDFLFHDFPVSWIYSANELVRPVSPEDGSGGEQVLTFYSVDDYQDALEQKLAFPHHAVFLLWRHFSDSEIEEMRILFALSLQQGGDPSDVLHQLAKNRQAESNQWFYLSEYGTSGK